MLFTTLRNNFANLFGCGIFRIDVYKSQKITNGIEIHSTRNTVVTNAEKEIVATTIDYMYNYDPKLTDSECISIYVRRNKVVGVTRLSVKPIESAGLADMNLTNIWVGKDIAQDKLLNLALAMYYGDKRIRAIYIRDSWNVLNKELLATWMAKNSNMPWKLKLIPL